MCDYDHVTIYWLLSNGAITQCGRKVHAIKAGRTSRVQHQQQAPSNPLLLKVRSLHIMELPPPLHPTSNHQIPDIEILEALSFLLSVGLDVGQGGVRLEDVSPLVGILLMVEEDGLVPVFQGTARVTGSTMRLDAPIRMGGWNVGSGLLAMRRRDGGGFAIDGTEDVINTLRSIVEGHDDSVAV